MMHCTMEDLLALRAGEGTTWARRHLEGCAACREDHENLRALLEADLGRPDGIHVPGG